MSASNGADMQKLFTCLYGSRLYGTQTPISDLDVKHIVLPALDSLLLGKKVENKVKKTNTEKNTRNGADDVDEEFIPLQVFARHFIEGQTYALELAFALEGTHANQTFYSLSTGKETFVGSASSITFATFVKELREQFLTSNIKAMMGYVVNQANLYSFKGERLNVTRELYEHLKFECYDENPDLDETRATLGNAYTGIEAMRSGIDSLCQKYPKYLRIDEYDIGGGRMRPCVTILEKTLPFTNTIQQTMTVLKTIMNKYGARAEQASEANVDWKAMMHALRIVDEGLELLSTHKMIFPFEQAYVDKLLSIKRGEQPLDLIKEELAQKLDKLKELEASTTLPINDAEFRERFDAWLVVWLRRFYNL
jgi:hypothetical protein